MTELSRPAALSVVHRRIFEATEVVIRLRDAEFVLRRGTPLPEEFRDLGIGYVLTAHDPHGVPSTAPENERRQQQLETALLQVPHSLLAPAVGRDPAPGPDRHEEASVAMWGVREFDVLRLASEFGQLAVFVLDPSSEDGLRVLATSGDVPPPDTPGEPQHDVGQADGSP